MRPLHTLPGALVLGGALLLHALAAGAGSAAGRASVELDAVRNRLVVQVTGPGGLERRTETQPTTDILDGVCSGAAADGYHVFAFTDTAYLAQFLLDPADATLHPVREFAGAVDIKGCAFDPATHSLFVLEEDIGLWRFDARPEGDGRRRLEAEPGHGKLREDAESLEWQDGALYVEGEPIALPALDSTPRVAYPTVRADAETVPVATRGDAADDPAIWRNPADPSASLIIGADKRFGLRVYDLAGDELARFPTGRINNVDLRELPAHPEFAALVAGSNRTRQSVSFFGISRGGEVSELKGSELATGLDDPYGLCLWRSNGELRVVVNDKDGRFRSWRLEVTGRTVSAEHVLDFRAENQPEGCVGDDSENRLFYGIEEVGLLQVTGTGAPRPIDLVDGPRLVADVEGMSLYLQPGGGYLVVSSQGDDSFAVYERLPPHLYRGSFRIAMDLEAGIDGVSETDGLDVHSGSFGPDYPEGIVVVQDGHNVLPGANQNFKIIDWRRVANVLELD